MPILRRRFFAMEWIRRDTCGDAGQRPEGYGVAHVQVPCGARVLQEETVGRNRWPLRTERAVCSGEKAVSLADRGDCR